MDIGFNVLTLVLWAVAVTGIIVVAAGTIFTVEQQTQEVVERFGRFLRVASPGLNVKYPFIDKRVETVSLRIEQLDVDVATITLDKVGVRIKVSVQNVVTDAQRAYYMLDDPEDQIETYVFDVVRARVPSMNLDDVFAKKSEIADAIASELAEQMDEFGYRVVKALVTDIMPAAEVVAAMNEINAAQRQRVAATEKGEAERILKVKAAEAEAQSKALQGRGIADQRRAIVEGLQESIAQFRDAIQGSTARDVMALVLLTQYFDTLKEIGASAKSTTILLPHSPGTVGALADQLRDGLIAAEQV